MTEINLALSDCGAASSDKGVRQIITNLFDQNNTKTYVLLQYLVRELVVDYFATRRGSNNSHNPNEQRSPSGANMNGPDNMKFDYLAEREDGDMPSIKPLPVTSPSQITINKHNNMLNGVNKRHIDLPSIKVNYLSSFCFCFCVVGYFLQYSLL